MQTPSRAYSYIREDTPKMYTPPYAWKRLKKLHPNARLRDFYTDRDGWDVRKLKDKIRTLKSQRRSPVRRGTKASPRRMERLRKTLRTMR